MIKNSVLEGLTKRRYEVRQASTESRAEDRVAIVLGLASLLCALCKSAFGGYYY